MSMNPVNSSTIDSIGYDQNSNKLTVKFKTGAIYEYLNVPHYVYDAVMSADSVGKALNNEVKGIYDYSKIQ
jgi:hypothetical protein